MEKIKENDVESEQKTLSVFCSDAIDVKARVTFDCCVVEGVQVTYWIDDAPDIETRINGMFAILFEEIIKTKEESRIETIKN